MKKPRLPKIRERIRAALADGPRTFFEVAIDVFPAEHFPRAFEYQANGGPPGCYMALSRATREMVAAGELSQWHSGPGPGHRHLRLVG